MASLDASSRSTLEDGVDVRFDRSKTARKRRRCRQG
jgi:hypothetical protein